VKNDTSLRQLICESPSRQKGELARERERDRERKIRDKDADGHDQRVPSEHIDVDAVLRFDFYCAAIIASPVDSILFLRGNDIWSQLTDVHHTKSTTQRPSTGDDRIRGIHGDPYDWVYGIPQTYATLGDQCRGPHVLTNQCPWL